MRKRFVGEQELLEAAYRLAVRIADSGWRPDCLAGLWPGGAVVGVYVQECLRHLGLHCHHNAVRCGGETGTLDAPGIGYLAQVLGPEQRLLLVDDVFASGRSTGALREALAARLGARMPVDVRVATVWRRGVQAPDFWLHDSADWLVMPYALDGLTRAEILAYKPVAADLLAATAAGPGSRGNR